MTGNEPFQKIANPNELKRLICEEKERPNFKIPIAKAYRNLIERCWSQNPEERPTFEEIQKKSNPEFITDEIFKELFLKYVKFINEFHVEFNSSNRINQFDEATSSKLHTFKEVDSYPDLLDMFSTETNDLSFFIKLDGFEKTKYKSSYFYEITKLYNADTNKEYAMKSLNGNFEYYTKSEVKNYIREIKIFTQLNHPTILKYIGFNPNECFYKNIPVIIMEFSPNGSIIRFH